MHSLAVSRDSHLGYSSLDSDLGADSADSYSIDSVGTFVVGSVGVLVVVVVEYPLLLALLLSSLHPVLLLAFISLAFLWTVCPFVSSLNAFKTCTQLPSTFTNICNDPGPLST